MLKFSKRTIAACAAAAVALAATAAVAASNPALSGDDAAYYQQNRSQFISHEQAAQIATNQVGGGTVKDVEFEHEFYGADHFDVEVRRDYLEYDVKIDAKTGKVIKVKQD